jgi:hypothetical protein
MLIDLLAIGSLLGFNPRKTPFMVLNQHELAIFEGGQFAPVCPGQFRPVLGGQFQTGESGQICPVKVVNFTGFSTYAA